jgi:serine protease Do
MEEKMRRILYTLICLTMLFTVTGCKKVPPGQSKADKKEAVIEKTVPVQTEVKEEEVAEAIVPEKEDEFLSKLNSSLSKISEKVKPSVVNISTTKKISFREHPFEDLFNDPLFRKFFGDKFHKFGEKREFSTSSLGSGVIVTADGYILTNNHVVKDVDEIKVTLHDKRELTGRVIGADPKSDLAIVKVEADGLPVIKMGKSGNLKVGEVVIAIGNPFGLDHTITMGIVSAIGRSNVGIAEYEDFIQTDAAINPGNSGGALVNVKSELIGINTAIFSTSGGYMGVGFAVPSDMADSVMQSILKHGKVVRGWLGVTIQNINPDLAKHFQIAHEKGALITNVLNDTPAEKAGLKRGDIIVEFDGKPVDDSTTLRNMVAGTLPEKESALKIIRNGNEMSITVIIGEQPDTSAGISGTYDNVLAGIHIQELTKEIKELMKLPQSVTGMIVTNIDENSHAAGMLKKDDVIQEINRNEIKNIENYKDAASHIKPEEEILLLVYRSGGYIYITLKP